MEYQIYGEKLDKPLVPETMVVDTGFVLTHIEEKIYLTRIENSIPIETHKFEYSAFSNLGAIIKSLGTIIFE